MKTSLVVRFPEAIVAIYAAKQTLKDVVAADLTATGSVQDESPVEWSVAGSPNEPTENAIHLVFTLDDADQAEALHTYLEDHAETTLVKTASRNEKVVTVQYEVS